MCGVMSTQSDPMKGPDTAEGDKGLSNPGPLEGPGSLWKLQQAERKPDQDQISATDDIPLEICPGNLNSHGLSPEVLTLGKSRDLGSLKDFSPSAPRRAGVLFQWKGCRGCWARATGGPCLRPWPAGYRSLYDGVRVSRFCTSCFLLPRVYECMFLGYPASSNKSALRLRYFRRSDALRSL